MKYLYAVLIVGALFGMYIWLTIQNRKTPVPEGCENLEPQCSACGITTCALRKTVEKKEKES
ncbi:MAG: hypothetical protein IJJ29_07610 [Solobacterium sp.]|nr:hypothetical protein [Solobacterium sp.]